MIIVITASRARYQRLKPNGVVKNSDSGRGMSDLDQRRLFQPFRTNFPSGTGLGMAISYRIVQSHGGEIDVASRQGAGTTITVSLPAHVAAVAGSRLPVARSASVLTGNR